MSSGSGDQNSLANEPKPREFHPRQKRRSVWFQRLLYFITNFYQLMQYIFHVIKLGISGVRVLFNGWCTALPPLPVVVLSACLFWFFFIVCDSIEQFERLYACVFKTRLQRPVTGWIRQRGLKHSVLMTAAGLFYGAYFVGLNFSSGDITVKETSILLHPPQRPFCSADFLNAMDGFVWPGLIAIFYNGLVLDLISKKFQDLNILP